eukprot:1959198-Prymnesium_polylepis.1
MALMYRASRRLTDRPSTCPIEYGEPIDGAATAHVALLTESETLEYRKFRCVSVTYVVAVSLTPYWPDVGIMAAFAKAVLSWLVVGPVS